MEEEMGNEELKEALKQLLGFIGLALAVAGITVVSVAASIGVVWITERVVLWALGGGM